MRADIQAIEDLLVTIASDTEGFDAVVTAASERKSARLPSESECSCGLPPRFY